MERQLCNHVSLDKIKVQEDFISAFDTLLSHQRQLLKKIEEKHGPGAFTVGVKAGDWQGKMHWMMEMIAAMHNELEEIRDWFPWKHWKSYQDYSFDKSAPEIKYEIIDIFHFMMNMMLIMDMDGKEVLQTYFSKREQNIKRQEKGY